MARKTLCSQPGVLCMSLGRVPESRGIITERITGRPLSKLVLCALLCFALRFDFASCRSGREQGSRDAAEGQGVRDLFSAETRSLPGSAMPSGGQADFLVAWWCGRAAERAWRPFQPSCQQAHPAPLPPSSSPSCLPSSIPSPI